MYPLFSHDIEHQRILGCQHLTTDIIIINQTRSDTDPDRKILDPVHPSPSVAVSELT